MYGQFQSPVASAAKWIFVSFIVVILMAFLLGVDIKDSKWLNSEIAAAEANHMNIDAQHQQEMNQLEQQVLTAKTEAEIREIQRQQGMLDARYIHQVQALNQDLVHQDLAFRTSMTILTIIGGTLAITLSIISTLWAGSKALAYVRSVAPKETYMKKFIPPVEKKIFSRESYDPWNSPAYRRSKRIAAQREERKEREEIAARMLRFRDPGHISTAEYKKSPEAD